MSAKAGTNSPGISRYPSTQAQGKQARDRRAEAVFCGCSLLTVYTSAPSLCVRQTQKIRLQSDSQKGRIAWGHPQNA